MSKVINPSSVLKIGIVLISALLLWLITFGTAHAFTPPAPITTEQKIVLLILILFLESAITLIFLHVIKTGTYLLKYVLLSNLFSYPIFLLLPVWILKTWFYPVFAGTIIFEIIFIHYVGSKLITLRYTILLSVLMNTASFFAGAYVIELI